jgi:hypothetical protein
VTGEGAPVSQELPLWKRWPRDCYCIARCRLGIPGQERPFMQAARLSRVLRIRLRIPPWPTWALHMPKSTPLGEVPVTRTLYDEPISQGLGDQHAHLLGGESETYRAVLTRRRRDCWTASQ